MKSVDILFFITDSFVLSPDSKMGVSKVIQTSD